MQRIWPKEPWGNWEIGMHNANKSQPSENENNKKKFIKKIPGQIQFEFHEELKTERYEGIY